MKTPLEKIRDLISPKNLYLLELLEKGYHKDAITLCQERILIAEDIEARLILALALKELGFSLLAEEQIGQIGGLIQRLKDLYEAISLTPGEDVCAMEGITVLEEEALPEETGERQSLVIPELEELATPSLAELYAEQGALKEAIDVYNRYLSLNPEDEASKKRLAELKKILIDPHQRLLNILERWLNFLRLSFSGSVG